MKAETVLNAYALAYHDSCRLAVWRPGEDTRAKWQRRMRQYQRFRTWLLHRMGEADDGSNGIPAMPLHSFPASGVNATSLDATGSRLASSDRHSRRRQDKRTPGRNRP